MADNWDVFSCETQEDKTQEKYYSIQEISDAYGISKDLIKAHCKNGALKAIAVHTCRTNPNNLKYAVPESTLLVKYGNPKQKLKYNPASQPDYYTNLWAEQDEEKEKAKERREHFLEERKKRVDYHEYLKSPEWKEKRNKRLALDNYTCRRCGSGKNLHVHHVSYKNLGTPEELDDLITLCEKCHAKVHERDFEGNLNNHD